MTSVVAERAEIEVVETPDGDRVVQVHYWTRCGRHLVEVSDPMPAGAVDVWVEEWTGSTVLAGRRKLTITA